MHCPGRNATDLIWRVLASSDRISCWTPLKPQHSNPNPLANQVCCIDFLTPPTHLIIPHRLLAFLESLMPLKNWCLLHERWSKSSLKHSICREWKRWKSLGIRPDEYGWWGRTGLPKSNISCHSEHFVENEKDGNHLVQGLMNMLEYISLNSIFFLVWFLLNVALHYHKEAQCFSYWWVQAIFLLNFHVYIVAVESINLHWVSDCGLKTQNE